ncbi:hypothetical protein Thimo_0524 [Thioflavicoccus mobilis 8321]|uniref:Uncharacterized protein n=1 Tax=Thioflavicoccus mobilis 8321 TaxID=765912 RepID=L0GTQ6_9GAMM|nr:hypothetical protein [Thioflavicoccus mobilis]AGA89376.1 hypothetical protein Thimo_0524 [Thioflavicoccus mobilis 8321]
MGSGALLEILAAVERQDEGDFQVLADAVLGHAPQLSVLLAWDAPRRALAGRLRALGLPLRVLLVGGPEHPDPGPLAATPGALVRIDPAAPGAALKRI